MTIKSTSNRIDKAFEDRSNLLNVYFTAGYPALNDTVRIAKALEEAGADMIEIGMPFSDPIADGPTIQQSNQQALNNGMSVKVLFEQLKVLRKQVQIPIILMGSINPILQFGMEDFCQACKLAGVDGTIIPDLPVDVYEQEYREIFEMNGLYNILLIAPTTSEDRIRSLDNASKGFLYMVSSASTTGAKSAIDDSQLNYFERVKNMDLNNQLIIGFGISDSQTFNIACSYASGAIIGSAFVNLLKDSINLEEDISAFIKGIRQ